MNTTIRRTLSPAQAEKMCKGKQKYESQFIAAREAGRVGFKYKRLMKVYNCPVCAGWHLATTASLL